MATKVLAMSGPGRSPEVASHSHSLTNRGHAVRGEHHVPLGEDGSLTRNILFGDGHLLEEHALGHHRTLTGKYGLLLLNAFDVRMEV